MFDHGKAPRGWSYYPSLRNPVAEFAATAEDYGGLPSGNPKTLSEISEG